jgi:hypothetical protein
VISRLADLVLPRLCDHAEVPATIGVVDVEDHQQSVLVALRKVVREELARAAGTRE